MQYILDTKVSKMDNHWKPASYFCSLCEMNYDYIVKFENHNEESKAFLQHSKLDQFIPTDNFSRKINVHISTEKMSR